MSDQDFKEVTATPVDGGGILAVIVRPLEFVAAGDDKRVASVRNLKQHIDQSVAQLLGGVRGTACYDLLLAIASRMSNYDDLDVAGKRACAREILRLIHEPEVLEQEWVPIYDPQDYGILSTDQIDQAEKLLIKPIQYLKGVGPVLAKRLGLVGIHTVRDMLHFVPYRYEDRRRILSINMLQEGITGVVVGLVHFAGVAFYRGLRKRVFEVIVKDDSGVIKLKWFRFSFGSFDEKIKKGDQIIVFGVPRQYRGTLEMHHPDFEVIKGEVDSLCFGRVVPIYREVRGVYPKTLRKIVFETVSSVAQRRYCFLPAPICKKYQFVSPAKAIRALHVPAGPLPSQVREQLQRVFSFEELFMYCLSLAMRKRQVVKRPGIVFSDTSPRLQSLLDQLSFKLTGGQQRILTKIIADMGSGQPMNRLLQGDVGSGKTIVAFLAALVAIDHGYQVAFLAPTELLAEQHAQTFSVWAQTLDIQIALLLGRQTKAEKGAVVEKLKTGEVAAVVGTHALLEMGVAFKSLGFVVVDEQHRFGVRQRCVMREKALEPHVLVMSATPIPRTLALTLYGDLDVSILDELPVGRLPVVTRIVEERDRARMYMDVEQHVGRDEQAFIVYPLVESSPYLQARDATSMASILQKEVFPQFRVGLLHGQMKAKEKEMLMRQFKQHALDVLVATTVIEVGIDIPNATLMVIEHPERFGLSQLHQLRGRVGRGSQAATCLLILPADTTKSARHRLNKFASIYDGFNLAEEDLKLRGPGDFFGMAQSGFPIFAHAQLPQDLAVLEQARQEVMRMLDQDPELTLPEHVHLHHLLATVWQDRLDLLRVG